MLVRPSDPARARARLAGRLERVLESAQRPPAAFTAAAPLNRPAILADRPILRTLVDELRSGEPIGVEGLVRVRRLLVDGAGPLYAPAPASELARAADAALDALRAGRQPANRYPTPGSVRT